jgi:dienelactone hydrolase
MRKRVALTLRNRFVTQAFLAMLLVAQFSASEVPARAAGTPPAPSQVGFPSATAGLQLTGVLYRPASSVPAPAIAIMSGTSGTEGFQNWEIPWALRLQAAGYVALIVDSFTARHLTFSEHWKLSAAARGQDALDAGSFLAKQPFVRRDEIGLFGRSGGGTAVLQAIVERPGARPLPFKMAVADYGYCQDPYGAWKGGTAAVRPADAAYRTTIPLLITMGTFDSHVPVAACEALAQNSKRAGENVTLMTYTGAEHAFDALYGDGTPQQKASVVNTIAAFIAKYLAPAPSGTPIEVSAAAFASSTSATGGRLVVRMQAGKGPGSATGLATLKQSGANVTVAINLSESASHAVAEIRQGQCGPQLYPYGEYHLGSVVNGTGSGLVRNVRLSYLMNGHFAVVVGLTPGAAVPLSCGNIQRNT